MGRHKLKLKIATKIMIWFLIVAFVPLAVVGYLSYENAKKQLEKEIMSKLISVADNKANLMENYIINKKNDVSTLTYNPIIINALQTITADSPESNELKVFFTYYEDVKGYSNAYLFSSKGDVVFSLKKGKDFHASCTDAKNKDCALGKAFKLSQTLLEPQISDFEYHKEIGQALIFVVAPVIKNNKFIGAVALEINNKEIYSMAKNYSGLGKTGEIIIGKRFGNKVVFISPTRHDPDAAFKRTVDINADNILPVVKAVLGKTGSGINIDYRGKKVLFAYRYLPSLNCGLVVKTDEAEAFASVEKLRNGIIIIMIFTFLWAIVAAYIVSKSISAPINRLHEGAEIIGDGNLDYETRIESNDEIGQLAGAFNEMTHNLKNVTASRDELNKEVNERKEMEKVMQINAAMMENVAEGINLVGLDDGIIKFANPKFENMFGYGKGEMIGKNVVILNAPVEKTPDSVKNDIVNMLKKTGHWQGEVRSVKKDGTIFWCYEKVTLFDHPEFGRVLVAVHTDITERKKYQDQLEERLHELEVFQKATINREKRIIELKEQIKELESKLGEKK